MLDHKMDTDLLFDVREFLVTTLADEKLSDQTQGIRHDLVRRLTTAQSFHTKPYQDMKPSPKKDKSELILLPHHHHLTHLHNLLSDHETQYENESCTSSGGSTSGAGSIECYEEIDPSVLAINNQLNNSINTANTYENISKISPSPSTMSVLSTSQYNELTAQISNNARVSNQYENTKQMLNMTNGNNGALLTNTGGNNNMVNGNNVGSVMSTKHGQVEIVTNKSSIGGKKSDDTVDGDVKSSTNALNGISNNGTNGMAGVTNGLAGSGLKAGDRKSSNGSMISLHDIKFSGILGGDSGKILNDIESQLSKHKPLNGSVSYPLGGMNTTMHGSNSNLHLQNLGNNLQNNLGNLQNNLSNLQSGVNKSGTLPTSNLSSSSSSTTSSNKNLSNMNSNNVEILSISASALKYSAARCGTLLKKEKILFVDHFKKYWMALVNGYLYLYNNDKDNKATSVINVYNEAEDARVYTARPSISKEKDHLLEIVAPGQKTHYFAANSNADMDLWITAINQCGQPPNSPTKSSCSNSSPSSSPVSNSFGAPSGKPSRPGSLHTSDTSRELPSLPTTPVATVFNEGFYDEPDALIRPVLHNYEHMINQQDSLYNEIDEKVSNENYYNISAHESRHSPSSLPSTPKTECHTPPSHPTHRRQCSRSLDFEREQEKLRELSMATYDQPKSNQCVMETHHCGQMEGKGLPSSGTQEGKGSCSGNSVGIPEMDEGEDGEAGDEKNCEETSELFSNNCQSNRIQHIIQRMEASSQQQTTPTQRRTKRPESQLIVPNYISSVTEKIIQ
uniref:PH domain-containing protein n=1 Tax=Cacopsylla melanoneura TaxID=428564 RepID=A0A8D8RSH1_9HEMI